MTREEIIKNAAQKYIITDKTCGVSVRTQAFISGAKWADEYPASSLVVKIWNLATKTAIAQINKEMPYFKSEKEIKEFINKKLNL